MRHDATRTRARLRRSRRHLFCGGVVLCLAVIAACAPGSRRVHIVGPAETLATLIEDRGTLTYATRTYTADGVPDSASFVNGLIVMRKPADLRPLGGHYYDDGLGNLVSIGTFKAPALGGRARYALTFLRDGGQQLALDFRDDAVVDVLLDVGRDGRLGALADPDTQWFLDCMSEQLAGGANIADAAGACLPSAPGGGGGGLGGGATRDVSRLSKPDCEERGGVPGSVAGPFWHERSVIIMELEDGHTVSAAQYENENGASYYDIQIRDDRGRVVYRETGYRNEHGELKVQELTWTEYDPETGEATTEHRRLEGGEVVEDTTVEVEIGEAELEEDGEAPPPAPDTDPARQPGPECEDCPVEDPRCAPAPNDIASLWDCQAEGRTLLECVARMRDAIYTATGGRCAAETGPDDRTTIRCSDQRLAECLNAGGSIEECLRSNPGYGGGETPTGPEGDDFMRDRFGRSRGRVGFYIDTTPVGAVLFAFCREGAEQFCRGGQGRF